MKDFAVFVSLDISYLDLFYLFINSYIRNSGIAESDFYIFTHDIKKEDIKVDFSYTLITIKDGIYKNKDEYDCFIKGTTLRFNGIDYLKSRYRRGLYLDVDIIINGDISELKEEFSEDLCAVVDLEYYNEYRQVYFPRHTPVLEFKDRKVPFSANYFNAGVLLVNFSTLDDFNFVKEFSPYANEYLFHDQDLLNIYFYDKQVKYLDTTYNSKVNGPLVVSGKIKELMEHREKMSTSRIIHFIGPKPWVSSENEMEFLIALQIPWEIFFYEVSYNKEIISAKFLDNVKKIENGILAEVNKFQARYRGYLKRKLAK